jgi:site-specific DNA-methyltransferase (adenine-specific)
MIEIDQIYNEDCLEGMKRIDDASVDCIITDLPYGTTCCAWDSVIPFEPLWEQFRRITKSNAAIVLFGSEPFSSALRMSNIKEWRYDWYWRKSRFGNYAQAPYMPLKNIEIISVFSQGTIAPNSKLKMTYNPQGIKEHNKLIKEKPCSANFRPNRKPQTFVSTHYNYPKQCLEFDNDGEQLHPTQKPVNLLRYLVLTYSNEGNLVLDATIGSGTTAIACLKERRHFLGFELNKEYFDIAQRRIALERQQPQLDFTEDSL